MTNHRTENATPTARDWAPWAIFFLAAVFRLYRLTDIPCGIWIDEGRMAFRAMVATSMGWQHILDWRPVSVPGSDAASHIYLVCFDAVQRAFGGGLLGVRMASVLPAIATAIPFWRVARSILPRSGALFAAVAFSVGLWSAGHGRWTWEQTLLILLHVGATASLLSWWRTGERRHLLALGAQCGVAIATYTTWPATVGSLLATTALTPWVRTGGHSGTKPNMTHALGWVFLSMTIAAAPFLWAYRTDPSPLFASYHELSSTSESADGKWTFSESAFDHLKMFFRPKGGSTQDGPAHLPVTDPVTALTFAIGLALLFRRSRSAATAILLPWLVLHWIGGPLSTEAEDPPYLRRIGALAPAVYLAAGLGWSWICSRRFLTPGPNGLPRAAIATGTVAAFIIAWNSWALFSQWAGTAAPMDRFGVAETRIGEDLRSLGEKDRAIVFTDILSGDLAAFFPETSAQTIRTLAGERIPEWGVNPDGTRILVLSPEFGDAIPQDVSITRIYGKLGATRTIESSAFTEPVYIGSTADGDIARWDRKPRKD